MKAPKRRLKVDSYPTVIQEVNSSRHQEPNAKRFRVDSSPTRVVQEENPNRQQVLYTDEDQPVLDTFTPLSDTFE